MMTIDDGSWQRGAHIDSLPFGDAQLIGFTIFHNGRNWQLSSRIEGEPWVVRVISEETAREILEYLTTIDRDVPKPTRRMMRLAP